MAAECFLGFFDVAARDAAVALTTRRHARRLAARAATGQALVRRWVVIHRLGAGAVTGAMEEAGLVS